MENKEWFLYVVDHHEGPFSADEIKKRVKKGMAKSSSYVWKDGLEDWMLMTDVTEFGPGTANSDGHGAFSFLTNLFPKKKKPVGEAAVAGAAAAALAAAGGQTASGPDVSDVSASDSVWCLNSQKQFTGPHSLKNIVRKINDGDVSVEDAVWKDGWSSFVRISNIAGFMEGVKPDVLSGKAPKKKNKKASSDAKATAAAMGMGGASSRSYTWYRSRKFIAFTIAIVLLSLYQGLTIGYLDPVLEKAPELQKTVKTKITELGLKPIPTWELNKYIDLGQEAVRPYAIKVLALMPEQIQTRFQILQVPDGLSPADAENIREIAAADPKRGLRLASAMPIGEERTPSFYISSNGPDGLILKVTLRGRENTLLNAIAYEKSVDVTINKRIAAVPPFTADGQMLPKGEYALIVYESDKQTSPEAMAALANTPKQATPQLIPAGKLAFVVDEFFLGGKRDAKYDQALKEYHDRTNVKLGAEAFELKQFSLELERMANESALKFQSFIVAPPSPQRKSRWGQYHDSYVKSAAQVKAGITAKNTPAALKESVVPQLWTKAFTTYQLTETLHQAETDAIEKGGTVTSVNAQAGQTATAVAELKQSVLKYLK